ncbi:hypothetical protein HERIO_1009 [Hepatospora eriocheir]|uniref:Uncharacterized protein n=1 Tax=Hepatospora eriocheir TaxID=1081669 RepID=A0A1X0QBE8_9MICR|nr:hypothetical protein HERIO_1009 [Hepatospora eriocheir]
MNYILLLIITCIYASCMEIMVISNDENNSFENNELYHDGSEDGSEDGNIYSTELVLDEESTEFNFEINSLKDINRPLYF